MKKLDESEFEGSSISNKIRRGRLLKLLLFIGILALLTFLYAHIKLITTSFFINCLANLLIGFIAFIFIKISGIKEDYGFKSWKSYCIGALIATVLVLFLDVIPVLLGQYDASHTDFVLWSFIRQFFYYILIIGPVEELIFRVYIQDTIVELLSKYKWLGVLAASILFGLWHLFSGGLIQALSAIVAGCVFGFCKYYIKNCMYTGVAVAHGLYDVLCGVVTILFVK